MQHRTTTAALCLSSILALAACAEPAPPSAPEVPEITREAAVTEARRDAQTRFNLAVSGATASRSNGVWLIDLRDADGAHAHYAISVDGSIRERRFTP